MKTAKDTMSIDHESSWECRTAGKKAKLAALFAASILSVGNICFAQSAPPFVVTTETILASYTVPPQVNGNALIQGAGFGTLGIDNFGDVFIGAYNSNAVYEFPASGAAPVPVYLSSSSGHAGAVAVDPHQNLVVSERFLDAMYMIPYVNGAYTPYTYASTNTYGPPPVPPGCTTPTPSSGAACTFVPQFYENPGGGGSVTGYYFQVLAMAFDPAGNFYMTTAFDNEGSTNIYMCSAASCIYGTGLPTILLHWTQHVDSVAADSAGNVYFVDGGTNLYELTVGAKTPTTVSTSFLQAQGVSLDQNGNVYVSDLGTPNTTTNTNDGAAIYEVPMESGALSPADTFMLFPLVFTAANTGYDSPVNIGTIGIALDQHGNVFATLGYNDLHKFTIDNASLPATGIGSISAAATLTVTFDKAVSLKSSAVTAAGVASTEFSVVTTGKSAGTCVIGTAFQVGASCTLAVNFTPAAPGLRAAILTLTDSDGDSVPVYLSGTGMGQAITVDPATQTSIGSNLKAPGAVAVDAAGNVFLADATANTVYEFAGGTGTGTTFGSGLRDPGGVAVDAGGNLYISDTGNDRVVMIPNNSGALDPSSQTTVLSSIKSPQQMSVDANGTLYIAETGNNDVVSYVARPGLGSSVITSAAVNGLLSPSDVVADASGRLYITDTGNNRVVEFDDGAISTVGSNLKAPAGLTLDASGSVIVADEGNGRIVRVPNESGVLTSSDQITINSSIANPHAVQTDSTGNLYAADATDAAAYFLNRTAGSIDFGRVNGNSSSVEETSVLASSGPVNLTFGSPLFSPLPAGSPFSVTSPATGGCAKLTGLASGFTCTLDTLFAPSTAVIGPQSYAVDFKTGARNTSAPKLELSGTAVNLTDAKVALIQTRPVNGKTYYGSPVTVEATVTSAKGTGVTPTGTVEFIVDGANGQPQTLGADGSAALTLNGLSGGTHTVAASYSGDEHYAPEASGTISISILPDSTIIGLAIVGYAVNPLTAEPPNPSNTGDSVVMAAEVVPSIGGALSGPVVFSSGGKVLGSAEVNGTTKGSATIYTAVLTINTLPEGTYNVVATYSGNSNYVPSTSTATQLIVTPPKFVLAENASAVTSSQNVPGSTNISVTSYAGFTGAVEFSCSGLPANATCQFVPAVLSLTATGSVPINVPVLPTHLSVLVDQPPLVTPTGIFWWSGLLLGLSLFGVASNRRARQRLWMRCVAGTLFVGSLSGLYGCGGAASFTTPTGSFTITVSATASPTGATNGSNNVTQSIPLKLTVH
jgi:sugar lactone lactonase YvrE